MCLTPWGTAWFVYVGLVTGACFAELGNGATCVDTEDTKVTKLQAGVIPIFEPGLRDGSALEDFMRTNGWLSAPRTSRRLIGGRIPPCTMSARFARLQVREDEHVRVLVQAGEGEVLAPQGAAEGGHELRGGGTAITHARRLRDHGQEEVACHRRSYDRDQYIDEAGHEETLLEKKRRAQGQTPSGRLTAAVPETQAFVQAAFAKGENAGSTTLKLLRLLDDYGAKALRAAVVEALQRETPRISSVAYLLERRRRAEGMRTPLPVDFSRRPDLADLVVRPHEAETYDELSHTDDDDKDS
jgi:hypothetical protein